MLLDMAWLTTALVAFGTCLVVRLLLRRRGLPPGPFPFPWIGGLFLFLKNRTIYDYLERLRMQFGDTFTVWTDKNPMVFICGWDLIKEALVTKRNDFAGRVQHGLMNLITEGNVDILLSDPSPRSDVLRKIGHAAVRKFISEPHLHEIVQELTDMELTNFLQETEPQDPKDSIEFICFSVIASSAFGRRFHKDGAEYRFLKSSFDKITELLQKCMPGEFFPLLNPFLKGPKDKIRNYSRRMLHFYIDILNDHKISYDGSIRDFTDAVLYARWEADPKEVGLKDLTDKDLLMTVFNLFNAGSDTMKSTILWALLFLALYPDVQEKAAREIKNNLKAGPPTWGNRSQCPYVCSVILEVMRMRPAAPFGLPHKTLRDTEIGGYKLPKDTAVTFCFDSVHFDESYWRNPELFRPERFLENIGIQKSHFLPFGWGRRSCIGQKIAQNVIFMVLARILQKASFTQVGETDTQPILSQTLSQPKPFSLRFSPR